MGAGGNIGEASENPVEINVTAMVDVIFCLCIFFMCSFHFKQLEGRIDAWMPDTKGNQTGIPKTPPVLEEVRIFMRWEADRNATTRKIGSQDVSTDDELIQAIRVRKDHYAQAGKSEVPAIIDAMEAVPWQEVVHVLDLLKAQKISPVEFAEPMQYRASNNNR